MSRILIAGSTGNIGSYLVKKLSNKHELVTLSKSNKIAKVHHAQLDLTDKNSLAAFSKKYKRFDCLIFLVGLAHKKGKNKDYSEFNTLNFLTLKNLLYSLKSESKLPEKVVFASTIAVYGESMNQKLYLEHNQTMPISPYAKTKLKSENFMMENYFSQSYILRLAPIYSKNFTLNIQRRTKIFNYKYRVGDGSKKLSLCNLKNVFSIVNSIIQGHLPQGVYNVSDCEEYSYNDLLNLDNDKTVLIFPKFLLKILFYFGVVTHNIFLKENLIKLLSDNIYPSKKIRPHVRLDYNLNDI